MFHARSYGTTSSVLRCNLIYLKAHPAIHAAAVLRRYLSDKHPQSTHYDLFPRSIPSGPPPKGPFSIDLKALRNEYLKLQANAHPDKVAAEAKRTAESQSAAINEAYRTLQDPLSRAQYLLSLRGLTGSVDESAKLADPGLLVDVLETREEVEAAESAEDLVKLDELNRKNIADSVEALESAFASDDVAVAEKEAVRLRYWMSIRSALSDWEDGRDAG